MSRLRTLDSRISFFAFADIITAVSGVLIFVALLLATDLGRPTNSRKPAANSQLEQKLQETLAQQIEVDAQNHRLQELLAVAESAPDFETLKSDVAKLRLQLAEEQKKQAALTDQMANSHDAIEARDKALGLTGLKAKVQQTLQETEFIAHHDVSARNQMNNLEQKVAQMESQLLKLRQREGQLWLIPDKSSTTKEPILVTVAGSGVTIEKFDNPQQRKQYGTSGANTAFQSYLRDAKSLDQYVVFLVRPSGIETFEELVKVARDAGFDVGYDALEEDRQIHFSTPPTIDEPAPPANTSADVPVPSVSTPSGNQASSSNIVPVTAPRQPNKPQGGTNSIPVQTKSWWRKLLEWTGLG